MGSGSKVRGCVYVTSGAATCFKLTVCLSTITCDIIYNIRCNQYNSETSRFCMRKLSPSEYFSTVTLFQLQRKIKCFHFAGTET